MRDHVSLAAPTRRLIMPSSHEHDWSRGGLGWDIYYAVVLAAVLLIIGIGPAPGSRAVAAAALAVMATWYVLVGRQQMQPADRPSCGGARAAVYIVGVTALFAAAQSQDPNAWFLAFALCPQFFCIAEPRRAMAAAITLNVIAGLLLVYRDPGLFGMATAVGITAFGAGFSAAYGSWMVRIIEQSRARAETIEQLEATRAELAEANREAGMLAERQRLATDIHDTLTQGFASIVMLIQAAEAEIGADQAAARRHLGLAADTARENLAEARALVAALAPAQLGGGKLDDALHRLASQTAGQLSTGAAFHVGGSPRPLDTRAQVMLLRVCQEALANVRKHAGARQAWVRLSYGPADVRLEVGDDGAGFDPAAEGAGEVGGGYGLRGMRARVDEAGGRLTVRSAPGEGTSVCVEVPA
jgi:signal transduction histidine kinase